MRKLILKNFLSPGDILTLTAAVRDLHLTHPDAFQTDVRTSCSALWENNPYITRLQESDPAVEQIHCHYPLINRSNQVPYHMIHGFRLDLEKRLSVRIEPHAFRGDIHLSSEEKGWMSQVEETEGLGARFWIIVSGGKRDFTAKWWDPERAQQVVDHFRGRIRFVQCGEGGHYHPRLKNVIDLVGKTDLRQMVRLMWHADGVICPVTMFMHLAAAIETKPGRPKNRPCVVIAGGREPSHWEAYPHHQFLHTNGALPCCDHGGCWKSRVEPLGDGDEKDHSLCTSTVILASGRKLPRCLDMITAADVIRAVENYLSFYVDAGSRVAAETQLHSPAGLISLPLKDQLSVNEVLAMKKSVTPDWMERFAAAWGTFEKAQIAPVAELKSLHARFIAQDPQGKNWTVGVRTMQWHRLESGAWVDAKPPNQLLLDEDVLETLQRFMEKTGREAQTVAADPASQSLKCPKCGDLVPTGKKFCAACGTMVAAVPPHLPEKKPVPTCVKCGERLNPGDTFCGGCGASTSPPPPPPLVPAERRCPNPRCGKIVATGKKFCSACGSKA